MFMKACGNKISPLDCVFSDSRIALKSKVAKESKYGQTAATTLETSTTGLSKVSGFIFGLMARDTKESGSQMKCQAKVLLSGRMVATLKENSKMA